MDNVINQSTVINGKKSTVIVGKDLTGQMLSGTYTLIGCSGSLTVISGKFYLCNCSGLIVANTNNAATVIRDGYNIGDYLFTSNTNPADIYGGYWEEVPQGTFLMAAGAGGSVDLTGGEATHTLSLNEMPRHFHTFPTAAGVVWNDGGPTARCAQGDTEFINKNTSEEGFGQPHNNLPPYRTAHIFKRIVNPTTGML